MACRWTRLGEPDARDRFGAGPDPSGRERAGRRGRRVSARLSRLPQDHPRQRAAHSRCAACRDGRALRDGSRCVARQAVASNQSRLPVQPAQSRRHRLVGGGASRARRLVRRARPDPGFRRDPLRSRLRRREAHADADCRARDRGPPDHVRRRDQDLQSRRRPCRRVHHLESGIEAPPRRADPGERSRLLQRLRHDRDRGGVADRRGVARCAAALSRRKAAICSMRASRPRCPAPARCISPQPISHGSIFPQPVSRPKTLPPGSKNRARIFASPGEQFGPGGETWLRFNFATPRPILEEALARLEDAFADLRAGK